MSENDASATSSRNPIHNVLIRFTALNGEMQSVCPIPQLREILDGRADRGCEQFWFGRGSMDGQCLLLADDRWVLFPLDVSDLDRWLERDAHAAPDDAAEVTPSEAADWLDKNNHCLPKTLMGRVLGEVSRGAAEDPTTAPNPTASQTENESCGETPGPLPQGLESRAVGLGHEMLKRLGWINVTEVARRLGVERTKLYRCTAFNALRLADRQQRQDRKSRYPKGSKDPYTGRTECASD
jgi:hypothetical protein